MSKMCNHIISYSRNGYMLWRDQVNTWVLFEPSNERGWRHCRAGERYLRREHSKQGEVGMLLAF